MNTESRWVQPSNYGAYENQISFSIPSDTSNILQHRIERVGYADRPSSSKSHSLGDHALTYFLGKSNGREDADHYAEHLAQFQTYSADVHQTGIGGAIDQQMQIARLGIGTVQYGSKHPRIARMVRFHRKTDTGLVNWQRFRRLHGSLGWLKHWERAISRRITETIRSVFWNSGSTAMENIRREALNKAIGERATWT